MSSTAAIDVRKGDWILTFTGAKFYSLDPRPEEVDIRDIAHALSMQCRYSGHTSSFYSVAEHSVRVSELCSPENALWGLLHDASEAYLVDLPRPIKRHSNLGDVYREAEGRLMKAICERFGLHPDEPAEVQHMDKALLCTEAKVLLPVNSWWAEWKQYLTGRERPIVYTLNPDQAEQAFLRTFENLGGH